MIVERQTYKDVGLHQIPGFMNAVRPDIVQLKYDGIWARVVCRNNEASVFSQTGALKTVFYIDRAFDCTLIGEYIYGSQWSKHCGFAGDILIFDCVEFLDADIRNLTYRRRYQKAACALDNILDHRLRLVKNYHAADYQQILNAYDSYEGVVFRDSDTPWDTNIFRHKHTHEETGFAVEFREGTGRLAGSLGSIGVAPQPNGTPVYWVGGGLSDEQRARIWASQNYYMNRQLDVSAKKKFTSGALRHPVFERWKE